MSNDLKIKQVTLRSITKVLALLVVANLATANLEAAECPLNLIAEPVAAVVGGIVTVAGYAVAVPMEVAGLLSMGIGHCCIGIGHGYIGIGHCLSGLGIKVGEISRSLSDELQKYPKSTATLVAAATLGYLYSKRA